jgi:transcriptional regulator of acetoin/glycerol metabolism
MISKALRDCNWNQSKAARLLAISRKTLLYRMGKYGISKDRLRGNGEGGGSA